MENNSQEQEMDKGCILIVDDSPAMQHHLKTLLGKAGYELHLAALGEDACVLAKRIRPHLILLDVMLPDMSGYEVCKSLKQTEETRDIPVVFVSSITEVEERIKGLKLGALDFIAKPIEKKILLTKTDTYVRLCRDDRMLKSMHAELQVSYSKHKQFSLALDNASEAVVFTDTQGQITYFNYLFQLLTQYSPETEADRMLANYFINPANLQTELYRVSLKSTPSTVESRMKNSTREFPVIIKCSAILDESGCPKGLMLVIQDQTERIKSDAERKSLEMELFHAQKLEAVGQLASGIAHEINTPVQFIGDNIHFIQDSLVQLFDLQQVQAKLLEAAKSAGLDAALTDAVEQAQVNADLDYLLEELPLAISQSLEGVDRVASIVLAMKEFAHPGTTEKAPACLQEAIETTLTVARNKWKYVATVETDFDDALPPVPCLISEFNQVILNLVVNACDAISDIVEGTGEKGHILISTRLAGAHAEVSVRDSGGGIPEKIQSRIFDPFFTTKDVGRGSGQGLAIAREVIVNKHGGKFFFETEVGEGTTFIIQLPLESDHG
ncbi:response regulator [Pontiella agarivorans]|uniref:histidine kinase n=1 Tax=Pontiella agarivorans TaxID=3038953 RepID=A0ABU5MT01_9BACT|nr:response regulator [Pontiella agarivorans]MDZ8117273.1 response regulator [Pontiella agarivorans]